MEHIYLVLVSIIYKILQTCRLKKVVTALNDKGLNMDKLMKKWDGMVKSQQTDDLDFQPLLAFMNQYVKCFS